MGVFLGPLGGLREVGEVQAGVQVSSSRPSSERVTLDGRRIIQRAPRASRSWAFSLGSWRDPSVAAYMSSCASGVFAGPLYLLTAHAAATNMLPANVAAPGAMGSHGLVTTTGLFPNVGTVAVNVAGQGVMQCAAVSMSGIGGSPAWSKTIPVRQVPMVLSAWGSEAGAVLGWRTVDRFGVSVLSGQFVFAEAVEGGFRGEVAFTPSGAVAGIQLRLMAGGPFVGGLRLAEGSSSAIAGAVARVSEISAWGHSYMAGVNVTPGSTVADGMAAVAASRLGLPLTNNAIGGTSLFSSSAGGSSWAMILQQVTRPASFLVQPGLTLFMYGINDVNKLGNTVSDLSPYATALRVALSRLRAVGVFEDSHGSVSFGAGWTPLAVTTANSGAGYRYNPTAGGTVTITTPADFPGGTLAVGFVGRSAGNGAVWTTVVNGTTYTIDTRNNRVDTHLPFVLRIPNVPAGSASYTLTTSSTQGAFGAVFDYWQWEPPEGQGRVVALVKQPKPLDYTGYGSVAPGPPTDAGIDALNMVQSQVAAEFGARVVTVDTSSIDKDPAAFVPGNVHPTTTGHAAIARMTTEALAAPADAVSEDWHPGQGVPMVVVRDPSQTMQLALPGNHRSDYAVTIEEVG